VFHDEIMEVCEDIDAHFKVWATSTSPITKHICMKKTQKNKHGKINEIKDMVENLHTYDMHTHVHARFTSTPV
jgi:hypothetical protein